MSSRKNLYKAYGVIALVVAVINFLYIIMAAFNIVNGTLGSILSFIDLDKYNLVIILVAVFVGIIILLMGYIEFSSSFTLSHILSKDNNESTGLIKRPGFTLSGWAYSIYASVVMTIVFLLSLALVVGSIFLAKVSAVLSIAIFISMFILTLNIFISEYSRFKWFVDILDIKESGKTVNINSLKKSVGLIRGYGFFTIIYNVIIALICLVSLIISVKPIMDISVFLGILVIFFQMVSIIYLILTSITKGCYFFDAKLIIEKQ